MNILRRFLLITAVVMVALFILTLQAQPPIPPDPGPPTTARCAGAPHVCANSDGAPPAVEAVSASSIGVFGQSGGAGLNGPAVRAINTNASGIGIFSSTKSSDANLVLGNVGTGDLIRGFTGPGGSNL